MARNNPVTVILDYVFGAADTLTAQYFSDLLGIDTSFIKDDLDNDKLLIYEKGLGPILAEKDYYFNK